MSLFLGPLPAAEEGSQPLLRRLDPRARILAACAFAIEIVFFQHSAPLMAALICAGGLMLAARLPIATTLKRMVMMDGFVVFMVLMLPFTVPGETAFTVWGWPASWEGLHQALIITLKANAAVLALLALVGSQEPAVLGHALGRLGVPPRLVHLLLFTVRYLDVIHQEYSRLRVAMKMRGFQARNTWHTYRSFGYLIGMLLVRALERSERILKAMKCRGFTGQLPLLDTLCYQSRDRLFAALWSMALLGLLAWELLEFGLYDRLF